MLNTVAALLLFELDTAWWLLLADELTALNIGGGQMRVSRRVASAITRGEKAVAAGTMLGYMLIGIVGDLDTRFARDALPIVPIGARGATRNQ